MCTSLVYRDGAGRAYFGRTLELTLDLPYMVAWLPAGFGVSSRIGDRPAVEFTTRHGVLAVTMPGRVPTAAAPLTPADLKAIEGLNDRGLTFSLLSYPAAGGPEAPVPAGTPVLSASDLGLWALGQFASVAEVKAALAKQPVMMERLATLGEALSPFHYAVHDASGASLVIEFHKGAMSVYDNPVGVMTNGPRFDWHLTNLDNYTYLTNVDQPVAKFGDYVATPPDSGAATSGLPASNTSVGRFVRAAYYAQYAEKADSPDKAVNILAHVMNNFDRPRGITIDLPQSGADHLEVQGLDALGGGGAQTEYTAWTSLSDLGRKLFFIRDYRSLNFTQIDLGGLADAKGPAAVPLETLGGAADATGALKAAARH